MAKTFDVRVDSVWPASTLRALLLDADALRSAALATGALAAQVTIEGDVSTIRRTLAVPDAARVLVKSAQVVIVEHRIWQGMAAVVDISIEGLVIGVRGRLSIEAVDAQSCSVHASGTIEAQMGFAGQFVESFVRDHLADAMRREIDALG